MPKNNLIQIRKGTSTEWTTANPVLASGEPGFDLTNRTLKIGNGSTPWSSLSSVVTEEITTLVTAGSGIDLSYNAVNDTLTISATGVSYSGHTHTSSDITDFNTSVSGLFSKTISTFTAKDNHPPATNFATLDTRNSILVLEFDATTDESAVFIGYIPDGAVLTNGLKTRISWAADTATSGNVRWGVQYEADGTDLDSDSFDTASLATSSANATCGIESIAEITSTSIDSLSAGDRFRLKVYRDADDTVNDTMSGDAQLIALEVRTM